MATRHSESWFVFRAPNFRTRHRHRTGNESTAGTIQFLAEEAAPAPTVGAGGRWCRADTGTAPNGVLVRRANRHHRVYETWPTITPRRVRERAAAAIRPGELMLAERAADQIDPWSDGSLRSDALRRP